MSSSVTVATKKMLRKRCACVLRTFTLFRSFASSRRLCVVLQMSWPFWRITNHSDMAALHHALDLGYLWWRHNGTVMTLHSSNAARTEWHVASLWRRMTSLRTEWSTSVWKQYLLKKPAKFPIHRQLKGWSSDYCPSGLPLPSTSIPNFPLSVVIRLLRERLWRLVQDGGQLFIDYFRLLRIILTTAIDSMLAWNCYSWLRVL